MITFTFYFNFVAESAADTVAVAEVPSFCGCLRGDNMMKPTK